MNSDNAADYGFVKPQKFSGLSSSPRPISFEEAISGSDSKFPRIEECAHFHYENVDYGQLQLSLAEEFSEGLRINGTFVFQGFKPAFSVKVACKERSWVVRRSLEHFEKLDTMLHECVYDRKYSKLPLLKEDTIAQRTLEEIQTLLRSYLRNLSAVTTVEHSSGGQISCAPVLHWMETDNHGRKLVPHAFGDVADINIPAVGAARVVRRYTALDEDELSLEVGDMVSIIEMGASGWWRGKQGWDVGSFPSQCVRRINSATDVMATHQRPFSPPPYTTNTTIDPITKKHGKIMDFLRSFLANRPSKSQLKKKGILKERIFGCDLGELLHTSGEDVPSVVLDCIRFIEKHGLVDGIYRISGVASHIRFLRYEFDSDHKPDFEKVVISLPKSSRVPGMSKEGNMICDPHSIAGLCKLYFRELPNPLLTYQLYNRFASAVSEYEGEERLLKVHDVIQQLPPPHYRTLKRLITHLRFMAGHDSQTSMHCRNLAIVWAPNLLRSRELEAGLAAFTEARVQSVVLEFLILNGDILFSEKLQTRQYDADHKPLRPRSLMIVNAPKLISLEEARARSKAVATPASSDSFNTSCSSENVNPSGVQMRQRSEASKSSYERRKQQKKVATSRPTSLAAVQSGGKLSKTLTGSLKIPGVRASNMEYVGDICENASPETLASTKPTLTTSRWKMKLGSLLRKGSAMDEAAASSHGSLRRCQSEDSLISFRSSVQKHSFDCEPERSLGHPTLTHAVSCEDPGLLDRAIPMPLVAHSLNQRTEIIDRQLRKTPPRKHSRPTGAVYSSDESNDFTDGRSSHVRWDESTKPSGKQLVHHNSSPFLGLGPDFPGVMGDSGLDFDPLSFKSSSVEGPPDNVCAELSRKNMFFATRDVIGYQVPKARTSPSVAVAVRRIDSMQSLHGEPSFAAISTPRDVSCELDANDATESAKDVAASVGNNVNDFTASPLQTGHASACGSSGLDSITADDCVLQPRPRQASNLPRRKSAADLLGVKREAASSRSVTSSADTSSRSSKRLGRINLDVNENVKDRNRGSSSTIAKRRNTTRASTPADRTKHGRASCNDNRDVEFQLGSARLTERDVDSFDLEFSARCDDEPSSGKLARKPHYGSLIALVGKRGSSNTNANCSIACDDDPTTYAFVESRIPLTTAIVRNTSQAVAVPEMSRDRRHGSSCQSPSNRLPPSSARRSIGGHSPKEYINRGANQREPGRSSASVRNSYCERHALASDKAICSSAQQHPALVEMFSPRLDSFNPEGRQRQDYQENITHAPARDSYSAMSEERGWSAENRVNVPHFRSHSVDSYRRSGNSELRGDVSVCTSGSAFETWNSSTTSVVQEDRSSIDSRQCTYYPIPAPRKHYRSFSAGDHLDSGTPVDVDRRKPVPLPRGSQRSQFPPARQFPAVCSSGSLENRNSEVVTRRQDYQSRSWDSALSDRQGRYYPIPRGPSYSNRSYEAVDHFTCSEGDDEGCDSYGYVRSAIPGGRNANPTGCRYDLESRQAPQPARSQSTSYTNSYEMFQPCHERRVCPAPRRRSGARNCSHAANAPGRTAITSAEARHSTGLSWV